MRPSQLLAAVFAVSSVSAAWPEAFNGVNGLAVKNMIYGRQDNNNNNKENSESAQSSQTEKPRQTTSGGESKETGKETGKASNSGSQNSASPTAKETGKGSGNSTSSPTPTEFDPRDPAGGIAMVTPGPFAGPQFYKIGDWVTFAWNYTSLSASPSAIDVLATCTANQATYTLAVNQSIQETGKVLWDTGAYQATASVPLLMATYTLMIYDADSSVSAAPKPGYLGTAKTFTFGMYMPQPYVPFSEFKCANCNSAMSAFESMTLKAMLITCGTTLGSLVYFAYSFGVL